MTAADATGYRYAALVFSPPSGPSSRVVMHGDKETFEGKILSLVPESEHTRWREWLGSVAWDKIRRAERIVIGRTAVDGPSVLGPEDHRLRGQMQNAWTAFLLASGAHSDPAWVLSGEAAGETFGAPLKTLSAAQQMDRVVHPFYKQRPDYVKIAWEKQYQATGGPPDEYWFRLWVEVDDLLSRRAPRPLIIGYALLAYASAWTQRLLEFSIPLFVRAIEGVVALPPGQGRTTFRDRSLKLVPSMRTDEYVAANIEELLVRLYELRNDCVHGKLPFHDMEARGAAGQDEAAQLNYVAEVLAREALLLALRRPDWSVFETRDGLQAAWQSGAFPNAS